MVRVKSRMFGHFLVSMPFLNYGGPSAVRAPSLPGWRGGERAARERVSLLELRSRAPWFGAPTSGWVASTRKITVVLDCRPVAARPRSGSSSTPRSAARCGDHKRRGSTVRFGVGSARAVLRASLPQHMRDLGTPRSAASAFRGCRAAFPDDVWFGCAYLRGKPVAARLRIPMAIGIRDDVGIVARRVQARIAQHALCTGHLWSVRASRGSAAFNFGRCTSGSGPHKFKLQWGARDEQLWWYDWRAGRMRSRL